MYLIFTALFMGVVVFLILQYQLKKSTTYQPTVKHDEPDTTEDTPVDFGFKQHWMAIKTTDTQQVAGALSSKQSYRCNWKKGISQAYNNATYITPAIDGWTLVVNPILRLDERSNNQKDVEQLKKLSLLFGEIQFFATHRVVEYHCWAKFVNGNLTRIYSYLGKHGENTWVEGDPTTAEEGLNLVNTLSEEAMNQPGYLDREDILTPNEETVMQIASAWSVDPSCISGRTNITGLGLICGR